jgi:hypothetical protein
MKDLSNFRQQILIDLIEDKIYMEENINEVENRKEDDYLKELKTMLEELTK